MSNYFEYKYFLYRLLSFLNFSFNKKIIGLRVLMYHSIDYRVENDIYNIYNIHLDTFLDHVDHFKKHSLVLLTPIELNQINSGLGITFDDGFANNLYKANEILEPLNIPFSVFVTANNVKKEKKGFLNESELKQLSNNKNVIIGSHAMNHIRLAELSRKMVIKELYESKVYLEDLIGYEVNTLSYPHGSVNRLVRDCAEEVGYKVGFISRSGINKNNRDRLLMMRNPILSKDNIAVLNEKIYGQWDWMRYRYKDPANL
jgi:peptidoglycan/xylan/chitin deacetylase (PgdA/CDA1 family)